MPEEQKETLFGWKSALSIIVGIFIAGIIAVVTVQGWLDSRIEEKFYQKSQGALLEQRVKNVEETGQDQVKKLDDLKTQQIQILLTIGQVSGKLDAIQNYNNRRKN